MLNDRLFGVYKAIVTDVSCFEETGKIKTRISVFNNGMVPDDLIDSYDSDSYSELTLRDVLTDIILPFGGGYDYGMFKLPQVNSVGLVTFIDGLRTNPIWIGSTANSIVNDENELVQTDIPSDKDNGFPAKYYDYSEGETVFNFDDENAFIIKTKKNELKEFNNPETMNWKNNPVENSFILSSLKASIYHRINDWAYQEFILSNDSKGDSGSIEMAYVIDEDYFRRITANDNSVILRNKNGDIEAKILLDNDGNIFINSFEDNAGNKLTGSRIETSIELTPASINIKAGHSRITMSRNVNEDSEKMTISANKIQIVANDISLGSSGYSFVVSPNAGLNFTLEDGSMLTTANHIRV